MINLLFDCFDSSSNSHLLALRHYKSLKNTKVMLKGQDYENVADTLSIDGKTVIIKSLAKFVDDKGVTDENWMTKLETLLDSKPNSICTFKHIDLSEEGFDVAISSNEFNRFMLDIDLNLVASKIDVEVVETITVPNSLIAFNNNHIASIGGLDFRSSSYDFTAISIRSAINDGASQVIDLVVACNIKRYDERDKSAFIAAFFNDYRYKFKNSNITSSNIQGINLGNDGIKACTKHMPSLIDALKIKGKLSGQTVGVISYGASINHIDACWLSACDSLIGVDYMGTHKDLNFEFVVTDNMQAIEEFLDSGKTGRVACASFIEDRINGRMVHSKDSYDCVLLDAITKSDLSSINAIELAVFAGAEKILLFGFDNNLIEGKSHCSGIEAHGTGDVWSDSESTKKLFAYQKESILKIAKANKVRMIYITSLN